MAGEKPVVIFGSGEMAELAHYYFSNDSERKVAAFSVDDGFISSDSLFGLPLIPFSKIASSFSPGTHDMFVALSYGRLNRLREEKFIQAKNSGYELASYICSKAVRWPDLVHGDNCFVLENQTLQPRVRLGDNVTLWSGNHIGHGTVIGDHTYVASHVVLSGHCNIGKRCFLGVNSTLRDFCTIGDDCFVAMNASVTRDLPSGAVALGQTGDVYPAEDRRARALKRAYFKC